MRRAEEIAYDKAYREMIHTRGEKSVKAYLEMCRDFRRMALIAGIMWLTAGVAGLAAMAWILFSR